MEHFADHKVYANKKSSITVPTIRDVNAIDYFAQLEKNKVHIAIHVTRGAPQGGFHGALCAARQLNPKCNHP